MNAEAMIGGEGFTQWSGAAQVNVLRLCSCGNRDYDFIVCEEG